MYKGSLLKSAGKIYGSGYNNVVPPLEEGETEINPYSYVETPFFIMKEIEQIDISGDVGLRVRGKSMEQLFENAAAGMFSLITDTSKIKETEQREIIFKTDNYEDTLVQWLNELIFLFDAYGFTGKIFSVSFQGDTFRAGVSGGIFDPERNGQKLLIKAATYHNLSLRKIDSHWEATVIFDI